MTDKTIDQMQKELASLKSLLPLFSGQSISANDIVKEYSPKQIATFLLAEIIYRKQEHHRYKNLINEIIDLGYEVEECYYDETTITCFYCGEPQYYTDERHASNCMFNKLKEEANES